MKELTIEEKAKSFKEALSRAKGFYKRFPEYKEILEKIFPELKESGDERTWIINYLNNRILNSAIIAEKENLKKAIAWLEKQGKQKPTDKIEQKFHEGDWVVCNNGSHPIFQVIERSWPNAKYRNIEGAEIFLNVDTLEKQYHLWTIQDAKDGDVLVSPLLGDDKGKEQIFMFKRISNRSYQDNCIEFYNRICDGVFHVNEEAYYMGTTSSPVYPATKEQRELFFKKMHDAGYEWDADKKELKKFEQKPAEWSEEDESHIRYLVECLENCKKGVALTMTTSTSQEYINWLKSLKPQSQWKPSEEQMDAVKLSAYCQNKQLSKVLFELYQDLKKLRED